MTRALLFDWGGVLMRTEDYKYRYAWDDRLGLPHGSVESVVHGIPEWSSLQLGEVDNALYYQALSTGLGLSSKEVTVLLDDFYRGDRLNEPLINLISDLSARAVPVGLLSNNIRELRQEIDRHNLTHLFDAIIISAEIGWVKPAPESYAIALDKLAAAAAKTLFIDDSLANIKGAEAVGLKSVLYSHDSEAHRTIFGWTGHG
jgi:putative hydrolase of the HAD superfamily